MVSVGDKPQVMPENVGMALFRPESQFRSIVVEIHYNNPALVPGMMDSSGFRFYYTAVPREIEAAWLQLGDPLTLLRGTPIEDGLTKYSFSCGGSCSSLVLADGEPVTVISETLHMHQTGVRMTNELIRDGEVVKTGKVDVFEFDAQGSFLVQQTNFQVQPGDSFRTTCYYRDGTAFGMSSQEEMCIAFYLYYPARQLDFGAFGSFPWFCAYGIDELPVCNEEMEVTALTSVEDLGRTFGTSPGTCSATVGDSSAGGEGAEDGQDGSAAGSSDPPAAGAQDGSAASSPWQTSVLMGLILATASQTFMRI
jgi:Copper type II ascorbate-dependent monooxygenase, C-terminal domain